VNLKFLEHPNIVKVYELYIDEVSQKIYSVMELVEGKEMFLHLHEKGKYTEDYARAKFK